jgi:hypothetical protein
MQQRDEKILKDSFIVFEYYKLKIQALFLEQNKIGNLTAKDSKEVTITRDKVFKKFIYYFQKVYKLHYDINKYIVSNEKEIKSYYIRNLSSYMEYFLNIQKQIIHEFDVVIDEEEFKIDYEYILKINSNDSIEDDDEILEVENADGSFNYTPEVETDLSNEERDKFLMVWDKFKKKMFETGVTP